MASLPWRPLNYPPNRVPNKGEDDA
jgi:hypothetical protein